MWGTFFQQTDKWSLQDYVIIFSFSAHWCSFCFYVLWIFSVSPTQHLYHEGNINLMARVEFLLKVVKIKEVWMYFLCKRDFTYAAFSASVYQISLLSKDSPGGGKTRGVRGEGERCGHTRLLYKTLSNFLLWLKSFYFLCRMALSVMCNVLNSIILQ